MFRLRMKRIVAVLYGLEPKEISTDERIPALLEKIHLLPIDDIELYSVQLQNRVHHPEGNHGQA